MRTKKQKQYTQEELNDIQDSYRDERSKLADLYFAARRRGDIERCKELWDIWKLQRSQERELLLEASRYAL